MATTLYDGYIWIDSYSDENLKRKDIKDLMKKIDISVGSGFDEMYPIGIPNKIVVEMEDGSIFEDMVVYPKGHFKNPMNIEELYEKYSRLSENVIMNYKDVWDLVWRLDKVSNIKEINELINTGLIR